MPGPVLGAGDTEGTRQPQIPAFLQLTFLWGKADSKQTSESYKLLKMVSVMEEK